MSATTLGAVIRDLWTDDVIDQRARNVRLVDNAHPGPPWYFARAQGDVYRFSRVEVGRDVLSLSPGQVLAALDADIADALDIITSMPLSTSEALEAGERRRCLLRLP